jgi:ribosomal protein L19E
MSASREKDSSDFDLDRFINMFDEALTSQDPRVIDALRGLLMIVTLTRSEVRTAVERGPLRRLVNDVTNLNRRLGVVENRVLAERDQAVSTTDKYNGTAFGQVEGRLYPNETWVQDQQIQSLRDQYMKGLVNK